jgi:hypothetical protein
MRAVSSEPGRLQRRPTLIDYAPPRWRFARCDGNDPHRVARHSLRSLQGWAPLPYTSAAWVQSGKYVLTVIGQMPVGANVATSLELPSVLDPLWANAQDSVLERRNIIPGALWLLKRAAEEARGIVSGRNLRQFRIIPLPHTNGEVLLLHPSGWRGRGIAWWQANVLLSLVWQVN